MIKKFMTLVMVTSIIYSIYSCSTVRHGTWFVNCTNDTLYMGMACCDNFDSIRYSLESKEFINELSEIPIDSMELINKIESYMDWDEINFRKIPVFPGSGCIQDDAVLFNAYRNDTTYIFVIKKQIAQKYTLEEIRDKKLYDKFPFVLKKTWKYVYVKYKGKGKKQEIFLSDDYIL